MTCKLTQHTCGGPFCDHCWRSMDSAPLDGTPILACTLGYGSRTDLGSHPRTVSFRVFHPNAPGKGAWRNSSGHKENWLTHWRPMPPQPETMP